MFVIKLARAFNARDCRGRSGAINVCLDDAICLPMLCVVPRVGLWATRVLSDRTETGLEMWDDAIHSDNDCGSTSVSRHRIKCLIVVTIIWIPASRKRACRVRNQFIFERYDRSEHRQRAERTIAGR